MPQIEIFGSASKKIISSIEIEEDQLSMSLMDFLRQNNIPISSSCYGEGVCKKCVISESMLSCQITLKNFLQISNTVSVSYL